MVYFASLVGAKFAEDFTILQKWLANGFVLCLWSTNLVYIWQFANTFEACEKLYGLACLNDLQ